MKRCKKSGNTLLPKTDESQFKTNKQTPPSPPPPQKKKKKKKRKEEKEKKRQGSKIAHDSAYHGWHTDYIAKVTQAQHSVTHMVRKRRRRMRRRGSRERGISNVYGQ